eukprot:2264402-Pyramimonas_sp.AAC.1
MLWMFRAIVWMLRAIVWMLRATVRMLRATVWVLRAIVCGCRGELNSAVVKRLVKDLTDCFRLRRFAGVGEKLKGRIEFSGGRVAQQGLNVRVEPLPYPLSRAGGARCRWGGPGRGTRC